MAGRTRLLVSHSKMVANCADLVLLAALPGSVRVSGFSESVRVSCGYDEEEGSPQGVAPWLRQPCASLAAQGADEGDAGASRASTDERSSVACALARPLAKGAFPGPVGREEPEAGPVLLGCGTGSVRHIVRSVGGWASALFAFVSVGLEVGVVEGGVWAVAVFARRRELGEHANTAFFLGLYGGLTAAELVRPRPLFPPAYAPITLL